MVEKHSLQTIQKILASSHINKYQKKFQKAKIANTNTIYKTLFLNLSFFAIISFTACDFVKTESVKEESGSLVTSDSTQPPSSTPDFTISQDQSTPPSASGDNSTFPTTSPLPSDLSIDEGFVINYNAESTNSSVVELSLTALIPYKVKIGSALDCSDGSWIDFQERLNWNLPQRNQNVTITLKYMDWEGGQSPCYRKSILHDDQGPNILFQKYPLASIEEGSPASLTVNVSDMLSKVQKVTCRLNSIEKNCVSGLSEISITNSSSGSYTFSIDAEDSLGNRSSKSVSWQVLSLTKKLTQEISVDDYKKVDILFVIDNSGSMEYEQKSMASRTSQFISILQGLDYHLAVTTTDPRNITLGDGRLVAFTGSNGSYVLDSSLDATVAQTRLSQTLQRPETGSGSEQGIRSVYRAIERYNSNENTMRGFIRDDAQLAVVIISDEDESDNTIKNDPQNLLGLIHETWKGQKRFSFHSIITRPGDSECRSTYGYTYGERLKMLSDLTGGIEGSVCETDYSAQVKGIAEGVRNLLKTITLQCQPANARPILILKDGIALNNSFHVEGVNIKFDSELDPGKYSVQYECLN